MTWDTRPNSVDPDGETRPCLPGEDPSFDNVQGATRPVQTGAAAFPAGSSIPSFYQREPRPEGVTQSFIEEDPLSHYQPISVQPPPPVKKMRRPTPSRRRRGVGCMPGCGCLLLPVLLLGLIYLLAPLRTNLLVLGADRSPEGTALSRTDTIILLSVNPLKPDIKMLSIPRDLWINIPGVGENRINTVHFFAESEKPGSGPATTVRVVSQTFQVPISYYVKVRFDGVVGIVDAMGGVDVNMPEAMSGYEAGWHHLDGKQALALARDRKGTDDFFRMAHGQLLIKAAVRQMFNPLTWVRLPLIAAAGFQMVDTDLPIWQWPRVGLAMARAVLSDGIDNRTLDRQMATPYMTSGGASVLLPQWDLINPLVQNMFGS
jgi:LCP family protein required for cell wall assembly